MMKTPIEDGFKQLACYSSERVKFITDSGADAALVKILEEKGVEVVLV